MTGRKSELDPEPAWRGPGPTSGLEHQAARGGAEPVSAAKEVVLALWIGVHHGWADDHGEMVAAQEISAAGRQAQSSQFVGVDATAGHQRGRVMAYQGHAMVNQWDVLIGPPPPTCRSSRRPGGATHRGCRSSRGGMIEPHPALS